MTKQHGKKVYDFAMRGVGIVAIGGGYGETSKGALDGAPLFLFVLLDSQR